MEPKLKTAAILIKDFFGMTAAQAIAEYKQLTPQDRLELGSAIACQYGWAESDCAFTFVAY